MTSPASPHNPLRVLAALLTGTLFLTGLPLAAAAELSGEDATFLLPAEDADLPVSEDDADLLTEKGSCKVKEYKGGSGSLSYRDDWWNIRGGWTNGCGGAGCDDVVYGVVTDSRGNSVTGFWAREFVGWVSGTRVCYTECSIFGRTEVHPGHVRPYMSGSTAYVDFECWSVFYGSMCGGRPAVLIAGEHGVELPVYL